jgi:hypothetical protein
MRTIHRAVLAVAVAFLLFAVATRDVNREARAAAAQFGPTVTPDAEWWAGQQQQRAQLSLGNS